MSSPVRSDLAALQAKYLAVREHTLSTAHLTGREQLEAEAEYVYGEARELRDAVLDWVARDEPWDAAGVFETHIRHELADHVLSAATLANMLPGDVTIEACIAEKTEADRGRG
jgi:hypothetical protein